MKAFDPNYKLLDEMYQDDYYPAFLVNKVKDELQKVIDLLESGETDTDAVQETLDEAVCGINDLQEKFDENDSEIETVARECIAADVAYILAWFTSPFPGWPPRYQWGCQTMPECRPHFPQCIPVPPFRSRCRSRQTPPGDH